MHIKILQQYCVRHLFKLYLSHNQRNQYDDYEKCIKSTVITLSVKPD